MANSRLRLIDEVQYVPEAELARLITALHRPRQNGRPITLVAGLPQIVGLAGRAKSYAERLFLFENIGPLPTEAATAAIVRPALAEDVAFDPDAVTAILEITRGYPYFLQEWGKHSWETATTSPITLDDVVLGTPAAIAALDAASFACASTGLLLRKNAIFEAWRSLGQGPTIRARSPT
jgi:hypothetical protein